MHQMKKLLVLIARQQFILHIFAKFTKRCDEIRTQKLFEKMASRMQLNFRMLMLRTGANVDKRNMLTLRNAAILRS